MEIYRELKMWGNPEALEQFIQKIGEFEQDMWRRDQEVEARLRESGGAPGTYYCFTCSKTGGLPASTVHLFRKSDRNMYVANVTPRDKSELSVEEYNRVVEDFHARCVEPAARETGVLVRLKDADMDIKDILTETTAHALRQFSAAANKATGSSHPSDQRRWFTFLVAAHKENTSLDVMTLKDWLIDEEGWPEQAASRLVVEYEFSRALLNQYDQSG